MKHCVGCIDIYPQCIEIIYKRDITGQYIIKHIFRENFISVILTWMVNPDPTYILDMDPDPTKTPGSATHVPPSQKVVK